jgi:hypothetical protein
MWKVTAGQKDLDITGHENESRPELFTEQEPDSQKPEYLGKHKK